MISELILLLRLCHFLAFSLYSLFILLLYQLKGWNATYVVSIGTLLI